VRADALEQVFLRREGGVYTVLLVFESPSGSRERVTLTAPRGDENAAVDYLVRYLVQRGATLARRPRLRVETAGALSDAPRLLERLTTAMAPVRRDSPGRRTSVRRR